MTTITRKEIRKRGFFGKVFLWVFWGFNLLMAFLLFAGLGDTGAAYQEMQTEAEQAGFAIGTAIGMGMILSLWFLGAAILGLMVFVTRGQKTIIETSE
jgi:hypothetical protein